MTARARLDRLESDLSPLAVVLLWLAEAQRYGSFGTYGAWLMDQPAAEWPLVRIPEHIRRLARRAVPRPSEAAVAQTIRDAVFRYKLIVQLNLAAIAAAVEAEQQTALLSAEAYIFLLEDELATLRPPRAGTNSRWDQLRTHWRPAVEGVIAGLDAADDAGRRLEARYLQGTPALFDDVEACLAGQRSSAEALMGLADVWLAPQPADGPGENSAARAEQAPEAARLASEAAADALAATIERKARQAAYDVLGEHRMGAALEEPAVRALSDVMQARFGHARTTGPPPADPAIS